MHSEWQSLLVRRFTSMMFPNARIRKNNQGPSGKSTPRISGTRRVSVGYPRSVTSRVTQRANCPGTHVRESVPPPTCRNERRMRQESLTNLRAPTNKGVCKELMHGKSTTLSTIVDINDEMVGTIRDDNRRLVAKAAAPLQFDPFSMCWGCWNDGSTEFRFVDNGEGEDVCRGCGCARLGNCFAASYEESRTSTQLYSVDTPQQNIVVQRAFAQCRQDTFVTNDQFRLGQMLYDKYSAAWRRQTGGTKPIPHHPMNIAIAMIMFACCCEEEARELIE